MTGLALIISIGGVADRILNWSNNQELSRIMAVLGFIVFSGGIIWFAFKSSDTPSFLRWRALGVLYFFTIVFSIWVGSWFTFMPTEQFNARNITGIRVVQAWVYVPISDQLLNRTITAAILVQGTDENHEPIDFRTAPKVLKPGSWVSIVLGIPYQLNIANGRFRWEENITESFVIFSNDEQYSGPIYIDDIVFYTER